MKIRVSFKSPDAVSMALDDITDEDKREKAYEAISKFVKYGEYVTIEIDTTTGKANVVPV